MDQAFHQEYGYQAKIMAISHDRTWAVGATAGLEPLDAGQLPRAERAMRTWLWPAATS